MVKAKSQKSGGKLIVISDMRKRGSTYNFRKNLKLQIRYADHSDSNSDSAGQPETNDSSSSTKVVPISLRTRKLLLTPKRKIMIRDFKLISSQDEKAAESYGKFGQDIWLQNLHKYMEERDSSVSLEDVKRWFKAHEWIREKPKIKNGKPAQSSPPRQVAETIENPENLENRENLENPGPIPNERPSGSKPLTSTPNSSPSKDGSSFPPEFDMESAVSQKLSRYLYQTLETSNKSQNYQDEPAGTTSENFSESSISLYREGKFKNVKPHTPEIGQSIGHTPYPAAAAGGHGIKMIGRKILGDLSNSCINMTNIEPDSTSNSNSNSSRETETSSTAGSEIEFTSFLASIHVGLTNRSRNHKTQNETQNVTSSSGGSILISSQSGELSATGSGSSIVTEQSSSGSNPNSTSTSTNTSQIDEDQILNSLMNIVNILMRNRHRQDNAQNPEQNMRFTNYERKLREIFGNIRPDLLAGRNSELNLHEVYKFLGL